MLIHKKFIRTLRLSTSHAKIQTYRSMGVPFGGSIVLDKLILTATTHSYKGSYFCRLIDLIPEFGQILVFFPVALCEREEYKAG